MRLNCTEERILIDTYPEAEREDLPMFAENRVHQRTSGDPYPNKVVLEAQRGVREKREYTLIKLENEFLEIGILPALGGKIWYAKDRVNGYEFFYKNNVIKPALIGVLGSWTSGGLEFNWPFHHRASTFMPVDYFIERGEGEITVWLSEHDPFDRMKGMVGVSLKAGECAFTTKVKLDNTTPLRRSFLWWENAAVPVNKSYRIFFPEDVNYVRFHYKRSVTSFPIADNERGAYNGILFGGKTDISRHENTHPATSYFSAESRFDYFGGYDEGKKAGVVHVADHRISPGKKMFTWGYNQLSKTWERALTDSDGQYAELMAGCYSDNQPDFCWLEPYECRTFEERWFPIHGCGTPAVANRDLALFREGRKLFVQSVRPVEKARFTVRKGKEETKTLSLPAYETVLLTEDLPEGAEVALFDGASLLLRYTFDCAYPREIPAPREELPDHTKEKNAEELYLEGVHMEQYRSPEYRGETCFREALKRDPMHAPSHCALAELALKRRDWREAEEEARKALARLTKFNARTESGRAYYLLALAELGLENFEEADAMFAHAAWCADTRAAAHFHLGLLALRRGDVAEACEELALAGCGAVQDAFRGYAAWLCGRGEQALEGALSRDPLDLYARAILCTVKGEPFYGYVRTDAEGVVLDIIQPMLEAGMKGEAARLLGEGLRLGALGASSAYVYEWLTGERTPALHEGIAFPSRSVEERALRAVLQKRKDGNAAFLLGCLLYGSCRYEEGERFFAAAAEEGNVRAIRCMAVYAYSRLHRPKQALGYLGLAQSLSGDKQLVFERAYVMFHAGVAPLEVARFLEEAGHDRDDLTVELARAYNLGGMGARALEVLLARPFVACEGGEHYIADQYSYAHYLLGKTLYGEGKYGEAAEEFRLARTLPASLGAGFWNECKEVPFRYFEAMCLIAMGKRAEAERILEDFKKFRIDYFSDMYLPALPYYVGRAYDLLGDRAAGERIVRECKEKTERAVSFRDTGPFGTTPFFISYIEEPRRARQTALSYPLALYSAFLGDKEEAERRMRIAKRDGYALCIEDFTL